MVYQLAKTTPYIGGQIRLDMVVHRQPEGSEYAYLIDEVHVVPLSDSIIYNDDIDYPTLNYSHLDNIRHLYRIIGDDMFKNFSVFNNPHKWLYNNKKYKIDTYDHTYELGMKRMRYSRYNKQFSYLTPMWITERIDDLWFKFTIHDGISDDNMHDHPEFINAGYGVHMTDAVKDYILEYISHTNDQVMSMKFGTYEAWIDGIYAPTGTLMHKDIEYTLTNILSREYTMMEFDYMLDSAWLNNRMIAKQLVNFNIVFDMEDILPPEYNEYLHNNFFNVDVDIMYSKYNSERTESTTAAALYKDIYSNYESIPGYNVQKNMSITGGYDDTKNVLDYIRDYNVKDLVYMNKVTQPITHWALSDNNEYTFNMYNGFAPYKGKSDERASGMFYNQPDLTLDTYSPISCNIQWTDIIDFSHYTNGTTRAMDYNYDDVLGIELQDNDVIWHHNVKYDLSKLDAKYRSNYDNFAVVIFLVDHINIDDLPEDRTIFLEDLTVQQAVHHCCVVISVFADHYIFRVIADKKGLDYATFSKLSTIHQVYAQAAAKDHFIFLQSFMQCAEKPYAIKLNTTYELSLAEAPQHMPPTSETDLYLVDEPVTLYRYSGNLMPQFIRPEIVDIPHTNRAYHYIQWMKDTPDEDHQISIAEYNKMLNTGFPADYPSIGYYALNRDADGTIGEYLDVNTIPALYIDDDEYWDEFVWFKKSRVKVLRHQETITATINSDDYNEQQLDELFWMLLYVRVWGDSEDINERRMDFLKEHYSMSVKFEYASLRDISNIDYTITFNLK